MAANAAMRIRTSPNDCTAAFLVVTCLQNGTPLTKRISTARYSEAATRLYRMNRKPSAGLQSQTDKGRKMTWGVKTKVIQSAECTPRANSLKTVEGTVVNSQFPR